MEEQSFLQCVLARCEFFHAIYHAILYIRGEAGQWIA